MAPIVFAGMSDQDIVFAFGTIVIVALVLGLSITRGGAKLQQAIRQRWPALAKDPSASDSAFASCATLLLSGAIAGVILYAAIRSTRVPPGYIVGWFLGVALIRWLAGRRIAGVVSGVVFAVVVVRGAIPEAEFSPAARDDLLSTVVLLFSISFVAGYCVSLLIGGVARVLYWLRRRLGQRGQGQ